MVAISELDDEFTDSRLISLVTLDWPNDSKLVWEKPPTDTALDIKKTAAMKDNNLINWLVFTLRTN